MKLDSPLFDRIRVKPAENRRRRPDRPVCDWPACKAEATHRAPKGRLREGQYWRFCLAHVREYNHSYNYFAGMSDDAVARFQKDAVTGHRPTWKMGLNGKPQPLRPGQRDYFAQMGGSYDPFGVFDDTQTARPRAAPDPSRTIRNAERKALDVLGLETDAEAQEIKARFKVLVKRHHPDANGGDRSYEDKLREIIQAYNYLKTMRLC